MEETKIHKGPESPADLQWSQGAKNPRMENHTNVTDQRTLLSDTNDSNQPDVETYDDDICIESDSVEGPPKGDTATDSNQGCDDPNSWLTKSKKKRRKIRNNLIKQIHKGRTDENDSLLKEMSDHKLCITLQPKKNWYKKKLQAKSSIISVIMENPLEVAILSGGQKDGSLSEEQSNIIIDKLTDNIYHVPKEEISPKFEKFSYQNGVLLITCYNNATVEWLKHEDFLNLWKAGTAMALNKYDYENGSMYRVRVPGEIQATPSILKLMSAQNPKLYTYNLIILQKFVDPEAVHLKLVVNDDFIAQLEKLDSRPYYGLTRVLFNSGKKNSNTGANSRYNFRKGVNKGVSKAAKKGKASNITTPWKPFENTARLERSGNASQLETYNNKALLKPFDNSVRPKPYDNSGRPKPLENRARMKPFENTARSEPFGNTSCLEPFNNSARMESFDNSASVKPFENITRIKPFEKTARLKPLDNTARFEPFDKTVPSSSLFQSNPLKRKASTADAPQSYPMVKHYIVPDRPQQNVSQFTQKSKEPIKKHLGSPPQPPPQYDGVMSFSQYFDSLKGPCWNQSAPRSTQSSNSSNFGEQFYSNTYNQSQTDVQKQPIRDYNYSETFQSGSQSYSKTFYQKADGRDDKYISQKPEVFEKSSGYPNLQKQSRDTMPFSSPRDPGSSIHSSWSRYSDSMKPSYVGRSTETERYAASSKQDRSSTSFSQISKRPGPNKYENFVAYYDRSHPSAEHKMREEQAKPFLEVKCTEAERYVDSTRKHDPSSSVPQQYYKQTYDARSTESERYLQPTSKHEPGSTAAERYPKVTQTLNRDPRSRSFSKR